MYDFAVTIKTLSIMFFDNARLITRLSNTRPSLVGFQVCDLFHFEVNLVCNQHFKERFLSVSIKDYSFKQPKLL